MTGRPTQLDGAGLRDAFCAGAARVLSQTALLNRINVFPVADGDTGTNLALTFSAIGQALEVTAASGIGEIAAVAADAALDAARGNSGAIVAEFLQGLADALGERAAADATTLAAAFENASRYARGALDSPLDGTILSAIAAVAASLVAASRERPDELASALEVAVEAVRQAVAATRDTLPALRRAGVEDAGARGFQLFFEGFVEGALGRATAPADSLRSTPAPAPADATGGLVATGEIVAFRFCTECTLLAPSIDRRRLHDELSLLGTSLVLAGRRNKMRIHIHTNEPSGVFAAARRHGTVADEKADDMLRQSQTHTMRTVAVVTDSGADLPEEVCEQLGIHVVPLRIHFADRTFLDKITLTNEGFMHEVAASDDHPRTSQPAPGDLRRVYEYLASHHPHVVAISLDAQVSGTWQAARTAARRSSAPERITVIDSRNASIGQGLIAAYAAECARAGLPLAELLEAVRRAVGATRSFAVVDDLSWAVRGGRLPAALGALTRILPIRPVLGMGNGAVRISGVMRRGADPVAMLLRQLTRQLAPGERYRFAVAHFDMAEAAARLGSALRERLADHAGVFVSELGAAASVHSGPRTIAAAVQAYRAPTASQ